MSELTVACFFWVDAARRMRRTYEVAAEHVRTWDAMVARHLKVPHRRVCITHRPDLVGDFIETVPIDPAKHVPGLCTVKLMVWRPDIASLLGERILVMDVDCVVTGDMGPLVDRSEDVVLWRNPNFEHGGRRGLYQGSMQLLSAGARPQIWADFDPRETPSWLNRRFGGGEQAWLSERLDLGFPVASWRWNEATWRETDGVYGAGRLVDGKMGVGVQTALPGNARVVFFPGDRSPHQSEVQAAHPWVKEHYR